MWRRALPPPPRPTFVQKPLRASDRLKFVKEEVRARLPSSELVPESVQAAATLQLARLRRAAPLSDEALEIEERLGWLTRVPWGSFTAKAGATVGVVEHRLDALLHGQQVAKRELAAGAVAGGSRPYPHLCLVGDRGLGKARLARGVADALGREFHQVPALELGQERSPDSGPTAAALALAHAGSMDPVVYVPGVELLDNDSDLPGLVAALHPQRSWAFHDPYLGCDVDLSRILWIFSHEGGVSRGVETAVADHLLAVQMHGYTPAQKAGIVRHSLLAETAAAAAAGLGLSDEMETRIDINDAALSALVWHHSPEAGVHLLQRALLRLCRAKAVQAVEEESGVPIVITEADVAAVLGFYHTEVHADAFPTRREHGDLPVGTVSTVSYVEGAGGGVDFCEAVLLPRREGEPRLLHTGGVPGGGTIADSVDVALSVVLASLRGTEAGCAVLEKGQVHVHWSAGPCDGSSAGVCAGLAIASLAAGVPVRRATTLTGELTLSGRVLAVGQLHDKLAAAQRHGYELMLLPEGNRAEFDALPDALRSGSVSVAFVSCFAEVHDIMLGRGRELSVAELADEGLLPQPGYASRSRSSPLSLS